MKKFLSAVLALTMALALCIPALAADTEVTMDGLAEGATVEVTGTTQTATVKILVPATGDIVLNPYELDYTVEGTTTPVQNQIISATQYVVNESNLPVKVTTKVTGTIEGADFMAATAVAETTKKVNLKFGIGATSAKDTEPTTFETKDLAKTETVFTDITMDKKGGTNPAVGYKFSGDAAKNPETPWTADDTIGATIAFTFKLVGGSASGGGGGGTTTEYNITKGSHVGSPTSVAIKDSGGNVITKAAENDTVTIEVAAGTGKAVTATVNGGSAITLNEGSDADAGKYTGTFTMPAGDAEVIVTVA